MKLRLIDDWKKFLKLYTVWFFILLGALPQMWDSVVQSGLLDTPLIPPQFKALVGTISALGIVARLIKQQRDVLETEVEAELKREQEKEAKEGRVKLFRAGRIPCPIMPLTLK